MSSPCTSGSSAVYSKLSMLTAVMSSHGACTISFLSGLVPIITIPTTNASLATMLAASDGGTISWTLSLDQRLLREDVSVRRQNKLRRFSK